MPLVPITLEADIREALEVGKNAPADSDPEALLAETSLKLALAIDSYIRSAVITSIVTIPVTSVPGLPGAGTATSTVIT
mgnify:CR=1 FL=1|tara:strand:- start:257 stop:493 length:237 start_codon:yes stop_codon:yes gene_type:complete